MDDSNDHRVLVVGLGISGIATAVRLQRAGWQLVIIEKAPARRSGGYFVGLFGAGQAAAERLGILDRMTDRAAVDGTTFDMDREGNRQAGLGFLDLPGRPRMVLRGDVERAAYAELPPDADIRFSTVPTRVDQDADSVDVTLRNTASGAETTERFALVVGADGLRSTVRSLVFGPHEQYLHRLNYITAAFELPHSLSDLAQGDGATLFEPGRSMWIFPFKNHPPTALFSYHTDDVDAEFRESPAQRVRAVFGGGPTGRSLGEALAALESADELLFDSVEQVHLDSWHRGRVVLVGDSAWCTTLYSGMGVSAGLSGADLLGTMLERRPDDLERALIEWETRLRPSIEYYQGLGVEQRTFFTPTTRFQIVQRRLLPQLKKLPLVERLLNRFKVEGKAGQMKEFDIAGECVECVQRGGGADRAGRTHLG